MAAGQGFKTFTTGEVLTAGDVNGYLMQGVLVFASAAARDAAITSPQEGQFAFTKDTNGLWYYDGAAWVASGATGDIEGVTAGIGISGGGTSGTVTVTNSMATAIDAKGDLVAGTGADTFAKLTVGANGTVLTAASGEATGLQWATPASGGGMTLLASGSVAASSTGFDLTGISGSYEELKLKVMDIDLNATTLIRFRLNNDSSGSYWSYLFGNDNATTPTDVSNGGTSIGVQYETFSTTANGATIIFNLPNYSDSIGYKQFTLQSSYTSSANGNSNFQRFGYWQNEEAITRISLTTSSSSFDSGATYELWGIK